MKSETARNILTTITLIIVIIMLCAIPWRAYARRSQIHENANLIRYTQFLLSRKGFYTGPIDGGCNIQTQQAIEKYKGLPPATPSDEICTKQFLEGLNDKLAASLSTGTSESHDIASQNITGERNLALIQADIDKLKSELSHTITTIDGINGGMSTHFINLSNSMATIAISALLASVALVVTFLLAFINTYVTIYMKTYVKEELEKLNTNVVKDSTTRPPK